MTTPDDTIQRINAALDDWEHRDAMRWTWNPPTDSAPEPAASLTAWSLNLAHWTWLTDDCQAHLTEWLANHGHDTRNVTRLDAETADGAHWITVHTYHRSADGHRHLRDAADGETEACTLREDLLVPELPVLEFTHPALDAAFVRHQEGPPQ